MKWLIYWCPLAYCVYVELQYWNALKQFVTESARLNRELDNRRLKEDSYMYGQILVERSGTLLTESWEDGELMKSNARQQVEITYNRHVKESFSKDHLANGRFSISRSSHRPYYLK